MELSFTNNLPFTSYTTFTPHSYSRKTFPVYVISDASYAQRYSEWTCESQQQQALHSWSSCCASRLGMWGAMLSDKVNYHMPNSSECMGSLAAACHLYFLLQLTWQFISVLQVTMSVLQVSIRYYKSCTLHLNKQWNWRCIDIPIQVGAVSPCTTGTWIWSSSVIKLDPISTAFSHEDRNSNNSIDSRLCGLLTT